MLPLLLLLGLSASAETIDLIRDSAGVPHIFAKTAAGAAFGAGYAQAEDRPDALLKNLSTATDTGDLPVSLRPMVEGFVAGVNQSLKAQGRTEEIRPEQVAAFARKLGLRCKRRRERAGNNDLRKFHFRKLLFR